MRLLCVETLELCQFDEPKKPPSYAIASHRWCDSEASLEDLQNREKRRKTSSAGLKKVQDFAKYVRHNVPSVSWVWIDTCCIDKKSSAEVQYSINSMFKWYRDAELCLAYLNDVESADDYDGFRRSVWFTRGWTLQELLAPRTVVFLTKHWEVIGNKGNLSEIFRGTFTGPALETQIAQITGIPKEILHNYEASYRLDVNEKRRWMDGRTTTLPEDIYYALLGILDLNLVVNYGIGRTRAEQGFQAAIDFKQNGATRKADLSKLSVVHTAIFNSSAEEATSICLEGTRSELLSSIQQWVNRSNGQFIFWLRGKAGTGKSTISRTIAQSLDQPHMLGREPCLGASFFFKRGEQDRGNAKLFFPTIAAQLADLIPQMRIPMSNALDKDSFLCEKGLQDQFEKLLLQPLLDLDPAHLPRQRILIVIDALDECDRSTDIRLFLRLLARIEAESAMQLRIFLTSRPELPIQLGFRQLHGKLYQDVVLEEAQKDTIRRDIRAYFDAEFEKIREARFDDTDLQDWPEESDVKALTDLAVPLFIFASTVCRFVSEVKPRTRLQKILAQRYAAVPSHLAKTYLPILNNLLEDKTKSEQDEVLQDFRKVVGPVVLAADPLSVASLAGLLRIPLRKISEEIDEPLRHLHSVLDIPPNRNDPVRLLHLSFRDFIIDPEREDRGAFWIDEAETHNKISHFCLQRLSEHRTLQSDICRTGRPGIKRFELSPQQIGTRLPPDIAYACSYWPFHFVKSGQPLLNNNPVHHFLQQHFLHWLEALSWLGRLSSVVTYISDLLSITQGDQSSKVFHFLQDARRFVLKNRHVIDLAPVQTYHSAMIFAPTRSIVRQAFHHQVPPLWALLPKVLSNWSAETQKLEGHDNWVTAVAFSPDGQVIASASSDKTVRLWNAATGEQTQKLEGHDSVVNVVAFSPDGQVIASASYDTTVRLWNAATGDMIQLISDVKKVYEISFLSDGKYLQTNAGTFRLEQAVPGSPTDVSTRTTSLELRDQWLRNQDEDLLWLPHEYRGTCLAICEKSLIIRQASGAIIIFRLK